MNEKLYLAGYERISIDTEAGLENTSIENQKDIIEDFVKKNFPGCTVDHFEDRDRSGYTFAQREGYQHMRKLFEQGKYNVLIIKDLSRFARRNGQGQVEFEYLIDLGIRIISIGDGIDYPTNPEDLIKIQIYFFVNEMPVTETSKKVRNVIKSRQKDGRWICAVPFGYVITDTKKMTFEVDEPSAEVVRTVFDLYNNGWGYKKIANHLTDLHIPTPRMVEKERKDSEGIENKIKAKEMWSIVTIQGILENDFYIGTLRQRKYARKKINGADVKVDESAHFIIEKNHDPIIDYRTWVIAQEQRQKRSVMNYRGIKVHDNTYSGYLYCGDCGSPMFSMSRGDLAPAYRCGLYHRRGTKGCTSHHIRVDLLDRLLKSYVKRVRENSENMIIHLEQAIKNEKKDTREDTTLVDKLQRIIEDAREEFKIAKRQKIREIMRNPSDEEMIEETYSEIEEELKHKIEGCENQIKLSLNKKNEIIKTNRVAKTAIEVFDEIIKKQMLERSDLEVIIDKIIVYEDRLEIKLKADIDALLNLENEDSAENFNSGTQIISQKIRNQRQKDLCVNVIGDGDPLEIFTDKDGEVIFKKYSPIGELGTFASQYAETLSKTSGHPTLITDKDNIIAVSGVSKKELVEKRVSLELEKIMQEKYAVMTKPSELKSTPVVEGVDKYNAAVVCPIISEGDSIGSVVFLASDNTTMGEVEAKLAQSAAGFLGKQMEQ